MTRIRRINVSQVEGDGANNSSNDEIRPYGELAVYVGDNNKLELLMFDGVRTHVRSKVLNKGTFYGGDADSSDQLNRDTIKLVPDEELRRNGSDQYLIIDPTFGEPGHIHIRAGGAIDSSSADLFLGGEKNNVRVSDTTDSVTITTDFGVDGQTRTWTFNNNGDIQLPGSSNGLIGEDEPGVVIHSDLGFAILTNANTESTKSWVFDDLGRLRLPGNATVENTETVLAAGTIITVPLNAAGDTVDYVGGASVLEIPKNADTNQVQAGWIITFSNDVQRTVSGVIDGGSYWAVQYNEANPSLGASTYPLTIQSANYNAGSNGNVTIGLNNLNEDPIEFVLGADGNLLLPVGIKAATDSSLSISTSRYPTITRTADTGSGQDTFVSDISEDDDIIAVQPGWRVNSGTEIAPIWHVVTAVSTDPGVSYTITIPEFEFLQGESYTFESTTPLQTGPWEFTSNGTLIAPGGIILSSEFQAGNPNYRDFSIEMLEPGDAFEHRWVFRNDATTELPGTLTFGDATTQTTAWTGNQEVSTTSAVKFNTVESNILGKVTIGSTLYNIVTIGLDTPFTNPLITVDQDLGPEFPDGQRIEITGVTLPAEVNGVWYVGFQSTRTFRIFDDIEQTDPPDASEWAGYTGGGIVKNLDIHSDLTLNVNGSEWSFDEFGNLTLPPTFEGYGDIKAPSGVSQLANRVEGSWTVGTGNIGVSFTVPEQGTYAMWVRGNIPNGIIVWNATATVTNTNVPVVGQQFAWVYTGGGTPIDFASIPDQFVGTAGTIVRSNPTGITSANQFNFTIANTSGSSQTVAWGYVKI